MSLLFYDSINQMRGVNENARKRAKKSARRDQRQNRAQHVGAGAPGRVAAAVQDAQRTL
jgi:hypothetical protein